MKRSNDLKPQSFPRRQSDSPSDAEISAAALNAIEWLTTIPPEAICLSVHNGWVNLEGTLEWSHQRDTLGEVIRHVPGVKGLTNSIRLRSECAVEAA